MNDTDPDACTSTSATSDDDVGELFTQIKSTEASVRITLLIFAQLLGLRCVATLAKGAYFEQIYWELLKGSALPLLTTLFVDHREVIMGGVVSFMVALLVLATRKKARGASVKLSCVAIVVFPTLSTLAQESYFKPVIKIFRALGGG